jgi:hypothetical protein
MLGDKRAKARAGKARAAERMADLIFCEWRNPAPKATAKQAD